MKTAVVLLCFIVAAYAASKSKYENFDVEPLLTNDRLLKAYLNCFLEKGRCTSEGAEFRKHLPEAVKTVCADCTEKQKSNLKRVGKAIKERHPEDWEILVKKNDPTGENRSKFIKFIDS